MMNLSGPLLFIRTALLFALLSTSGVAQETQLGIDFQTLSFSESLQTSQYEHTEYIQPCSYEQGTSDKHTLGHLVCQTEHGTRRQKSYLFGTVFSEKSLIGSFFDPRRERLLPILGNQARKRGYDIPLPYGVGGNIAYIDQSMNIEQISLSVAGGPANPLPEIPPFSIQSRDTNYSMRYDVWLLPFFNVYGIVGETRGSAVGDVTITGVSGLPPNTVIPVRIDYDGPTYGAGCTGAIGYKNIFAVVDWNYTTTELDGLDAGIDARTIAPRVGMNFDNTAVWIGGFYMNVDKNLSSTVDVGGIPVGILVDLDVETAWNIIYGFRWAPCPNLELVVEHGFSRRNQVVGAAAFRF